MRFLILILISQLIIGCGSVSNYTPPGSHRLISSTCNAPTINLVLPEQNLFEENRETTFVVTQYSKSCIHTGKGKFYTVGGLTSITEDNIKADRECNDPFLFPEVFTAVVEGSKVTIISNSCTLVFQQTN